MIVLRCIRVCNLEYLEIGWQFQLIAFRETDYLVEPVTQPRIFAGEDVEQFMANDFRQVIHASVQERFRENDGLAAGVSGASFLEASRLNEKNRRWQREVEILQ